MVDYFSFQLTPSQISLFYFVALLIGMSKTGVHGTGMMAVPLLASIFGGQLSSGILLPMLCLADVFGVWYYHRHASWDHLKQLFPAAAVGTILGTIVGGYIDDTYFKAFMAIAILFTICLMLWLEHGSKKEIPQTTLFANVTGVTAGFTSMVGNLAGSVMAVYFLSMRLPKNIFIGTAAWFFLTINFFKLPFHILHWKTITFNSLLMDLTAIPVIITGGIAGIFIVKTFSEKSYRWFILSMTMLAAILMLI